MGPSPSQGFGSPYGGYGGYGNNFQQRSYQPPSYQPQGMTGGNMFGGMQKPAPYVPPMTGFRPMPTPPMATTGGNMYPGSVAVGPTAGDRSAGPSAPIPAATTGGNMLGFDANAGGRLVADPAPAPYPQATTNTFASPYFGGGGSYYQGGW